MKNIFILSALFASALFSNAQSVSDGLLYTGTDLKGTARYRGLSGAFGALGGDLSAIGSNPASSVVFANNFTAVTLGILGNDNTSDYFGTSTETVNTDVAISQAGGVLVFESPANKTISKFAMSLNYDLTRSFDSSKRIRGTSPTSVSQYFLNNANGIELDNFTLLPGESVSSLYQFLGQELGFGAQQGFLGYESFLIDATDNNDPNNTDYTSNTGTGSFNQDYLVETRGQSSKISFNGALEINKKWNLGINLNAHALSTERFTSIEESNSNADATVTDVRFDNSLYTNGNGFSFQLGLLGKLTENLRVGATYESLTWYTMEESQIQEVSTLGSNSSGTARVRPNVLNIFAPYGLRAPGSATGSIAYIFGKKGLISLDYTSRNYSQLKFRTANSNLLTSDYQFSSANPQNNSSPNSSDLFRNNNNFINEKLARAESLRIGGEYRIQNWTLRGGYRFEESPYEDKAIMGDLTGYSLGFGYTWGRTILDISYDHSEQDFSQQLFDTGLNKSAGVFNQMDNIVITLGFNL
jgi:long-subunit fatty acid transport protein